LVGKKIGISIEYTSGPSWNEFLAMLRNREINVMGNTVKTPDRSEYTVFTEPIFIDPPAIFMRLDRNPVNSLDQLEREERTLHLSLYGGSCPKPPFNGLRPLKIPE
jgi:hypothetical protein